MAKTYENYPYSLILACNIFSFVIYAIGVYLLSRISVYLMIPYIIFILWCESRVLKHSCINCYYYGKRCAFGKGKVCSIFFSKGNPKEFLSKKITWKSVAPDFLVFIIPLIAGIAVLIMDFKLTILALVIALFLLGFMGSAFVRGKIACRHCRQRELGCPAEKLFNKKR